MIKEINELDLLKMKDKEGLILQGCGGDLNDWLQGINEDFTKRNILMNNSKFEDIYSFKSGEITNLLFPLDNADVNIPKLAMWRIGTHEVFGGTWLSDYIDNRLSDKEEVCRELFHDLLWYQKESFRALQQSSCHQRTCVLCGKDRYLQHQTCVPRKHHAECLHLFLPQDVYICRKAASIRQKHRRIRQPVL